MKKFINTQPQTWHQPTTKNGMGRAMDDNWG